MAEIQTEWALVFKTEELDAGMQHVKDVSNDTTKSIGEGWNTAGTAAVDALKKLLSQSEETHGRTKEQIEKASQAVDLLNDALGIKVPAALQKMAAESEIVGPIMEEAFPVLAAIALASMIADIIGKIGDWITSLRELSDEEKNSVNAEANHYKKSIEFAHKIIELRRQALLVGKSEVEQARLRAQFAREDEEQDKGYLGMARGEYAAARALLEESEKHEMRKTDQYWTNTRTGMRNYKYEPVISDKQVEKAQKDLLRLKDMYGEGLEDLEQETVLAGERRNLADTQAAQANLNIHKQHLDALEGLYQKNRSQNQTEIVSLDDIVHRQNKIVIAKKDANQAANQELTIEQILASAREVTLKQAQQEAEFAEKSAANNKNISDLQKDIANSAAEHNRAMAVALGYKTQEKADAEALAALEQDKKKTLADANNALTAQIGVVKNLAQATMGGMLGSPEQKAAFQKAILDYQKLKIEQLNLEKKYDDQIAALQLKLANTFSAQFRKQLLSWQEINKELGQTFQTTLNGLNSSLASFITTGTANWKQLASSAIESIIQIGLQYAESQLLMAIIGKGAADSETRTKAQSGLAQVEIAADVAMANAYAAHAALPVVAAAMAVAAGAVVRSFAVPIAAVGAKSSAGGDWQVDTDRLNFVHKDETILPAGIAGKLRSMVESGGTGAGVTVVVNHSVSAVDAASFQGHIRRHGNMIANEVTRALKRKGVR
ncbi:MAG TPA: phage tail tape measure C-terminal domain-containing protein [Candidatus Angelobacter sp.]|nr:phage tail tape measure C-terminal domain-containing protein [Candidatus Angelobacter sp.]